MEITFEELRRIQLNEKNNPALTELPEDFYEKVESFVCAWSKRLEKENSTQSFREYENTLKILRDIYRRREQKVTVKALRAARNSEEAAGLAKEEKALLAGIVGLLNENLNKFEARLSGNGRGRLEGRPLRILCDVPAFVGKDGKTYGPLSKGETLLLAPEAAEMLLKRKLAVEG